MKVTGTVRIEVERDGRVIQTSTKSNLITTAGLDMLADFITSGSALQCTHIGVGTGTTPPAAGDTALETEVHVEAVTVVTSTDGLATLKAVIGTGDANGNTLSEAGLLTAASSGVLFARLLFDPTVAKTSADTVTITWTVTFTDN